MVHLLAWVARAKHHRVWRSNLVVLELGGLGEFDPCVVHVLLTGHHLYHLLLPKLVRVLIQRWGEEPRVWVARLDFEDWGLLQLRGLWEHPQFWLTDALVLSLHRAVIVEVSLEVVGAL